MVFSSIFWQFGRIIKTFETRYKFCKKKKIVIMLAVFFKLSDFDN